MASGVRAKAALFGQLASGVTGSSAATSSANTTTIQLPPTSSASISDPSISHPLAAASFVSRATTKTSPAPVCNVGSAVGREQTHGATSTPRADSNAQSSSATQSSRRKKVEALTEQDNAKGTASHIASANSPPIVPLKAYPPKLTEAAPQTPFALSFAANDVLPNSLSSNSMDGRSTHIQSRSRIPRLSVSRGSGTAKVSGNSGRSMASEAGPDLSRESVYSTTSSLGGTASAVVSTANAVSIQRITNQPRNVGNLAQSSQVRPVPGPSVDKGIGVKMRRKSRESSSSERRWPKSGRSSTTTTPAQTSTHDRALEGSDDGRQQTPFADGTIRNRSEPGHSRGQLPDRASERSKEAYGPPKKESGSSLHSATKSRDPLTLSKSTPGTQQSELLGPLDRARPHRNFSNESKAGSSVGQMSRVASNSSSISHISAERAPWDADNRSTASHGDRMSVSASEVLNPLSDAWGQNSSVASQSYEDEVLTSMGALAFAPHSPISPTDSRIDRLGTQTPTVRRPSISSNAPIGSDDFSGRSRSGTIRSDVGQAAYMIGPTSKSGNSQGDKTRPIKDSLLMQLLASMSLVDAQSFSTLSSLEEVEALKRELTRTERRIVDVQHKLKVQIRMRDAADKLRRAGARSRSAWHAQSTSVSSAVANGSTLNQPKHQRQISTASSAGNVDMQQAEADVASATKRVDQVSRELLELFAEASKTRRRLLEHHAGILGARVKTLEEEVQDHQLQSNDREEEEDEKAKVGAILAAEELDQVRDKLVRIERTLEHERIEREAEVQRWRKKHEEDTQTLSLRHGKVLAEAEAQSKSLVEQHSKTLAQEKDRISELEALVKTQQHEYEGLQHQMEQLGFETTAERNLMLERQKLFSAFEHRLEHGEKRLREQDERCARLLGKAEGREEMDDLLNQIKYGTGASSRKEKTAGQDIDGLIDSLTTHINDLEDELMRANVGRAQDTLESDIAGPHSPATLAVPDASTVRDVRELSVELQSTQREAEEWRTKAESAKRQLAALQRQSAISMTSTNARLSISGWGGQSASGRRPSTSNLRIGSMRSAAELEARITLLEKRNAALEAELAHGRDPTRSATSTYDTQLQRSPPSKVAGSNQNSIDRGHSFVGAGNFFNTVRTLIGLLPALDPDSTDLHEIQEALESIPRNSGIDLSSSNVNEVCRIVEERTRSVLFVSRSLIGKALALEMERRDFDEEMEAIEGDREELKAAVEDLRSGHAAQLQIIEAGKSHVQQSQSKIDELERSLDEARRALEAHKQSIPVASHAMRTSPSLTSMISSQGGIGSHGTVPLQQRRNVMPVRNTKLTALTPATSARPAGATLTASLSPSSSKLSFASTAQSASTPATSHPTWSPAALANGNSSHTSSTQDHAFAAASALDPERVVEVTSTPGVRRSTISQKVAPTPRTMMLGMGPAQMMERIRQLEAELLQAKMGSHRTKADEEERARMEGELDECRTELEEHRREIDEVRNVESRQRIELLEELTSLTSELSEARSQLRQEQRRKEQQALHRNIVNA